MNHRLALILYYVAWAVTTLAATITPISIQNIATGYGESSFYQFSFTFDGLVNQVQGGIKIVFPPQLGLEYFPVNLECYSKVPDLDVKKVNCDVDSKRVIYMTIGVVVKGDYIIAVGPITNPLGISGTSAFQLCVMLNDLEISCHDSFGKVSFFNLPGKISLL